MSGYNPKVALPAFSGRAVEVVATPASRKASERLMVAQERLQRLFQPNYRCKLVWGRKKLTLGKDRELELVKLTKTSVQVHPILAHAKIPDDVLEAAVFLGMIMHKGFSAQTRPSGSPFDYAVLAEWIGQQMSLLPASEFLRQFIARFDVWIKKVVS